MEQLHKDMAKRMKKTLKKLEYAMGIGFTSAENFSSYHRTK